MTEPIKLTEDDFEEDYDADRWTTQITKIFDSEEEQIQFKQQILQDQKLRELLKGDAERLSKLESPNPVDQLLLDYIIPAIKESEK